MTLSEVIAAATAHHNALLIAGDTDVANRHDYIAAAVAAHLTSEAVVERAAKAAYRMAVIKGVSRSWEKHDDDTREHWRNCVRAAVP